MDKFVVLHKKRCLLSIVFHNERDKTSICIRIFLKLDLLLHECEGIIQTFQVLNNGISKSVFYAYYNVPITVDTIYFEFPHL